MLPQFRDCNIQEHAACHLSVEKEAVVVENKWRKFWNRNQGLVFVVLSQIFSALMNVATRLLELEGDGMDPLQILFVRMLITSVFCCAWMWWKKVPDFPLGEKGIRWLLVVRGISGFFGMYGMYYSLQYLPVAEAVVLSFLTPYVASYACYIFLKERFSRAAQYASIVSLLGVVLVSDPISFFTSPPTQPRNATDAHLDSTTFPTTTAAQRFSAVALAMVGVLGAAGAFTSIRAIGSRAHPLISVNYFSVWCTIITTISLTLAKPLRLSTSLSFALPSSLRQLSMLIFLGLCGFAYQFLQTKGLVVGGRENGARATSMIYTNVLFALVLDKVVFGDTPGWWSLCGSVLILGSALFAALQKQEGETKGSIEDEEQG